MILTLFIPRWMRGKHSTKVGRAPLFGLSLIIDVGSQTPTVIGQAVIIGGKGVELFFLKFQRVIRIAKLMKQLMMARL